MRPKQVLDAVKDEVLDALPHCSLGREGRKNGAYQRKFKFALKADADSEPMHYGKPEPYIWLNESESVTDPDYEKEIEKIGDMKLYDGDDEHKNVQGISSQLRYAGGTKHTDIRRQRNPHRFRKVVQSTPPRTFLVEMK